MLILENKFPLTGNTGQRWPAQKLSVPCRVRKVLSLSRSRSPSRSFCVLNSCYFIFSSNLPVAVIKQDLTSPLRCVVI